MKGLSTETGRLAAQQAQQAHQAQLIQQTSNHHHSGHHLQPPLAHHHQEHDVHQSPSGSQLSPEHLDSPLPDTGHNDGCHVRSTNIGANGPCPMEGLQMGGGGGIGNNTSNGCNSAITTMNTSTGSSSCSGGSSGCGGNNGLMSGHVERCPSAGSIIGGGSTNSSGLGMANSNNMVVGSNSSGMSVGSIGGGGSGGHSFGGSNGNLKQECDSLIHTNNSTLSNVVPSYVPPMYRPIAYEPLRKRALRSPYAEQELRGSVLRDGSKNSPECSSPVSKANYHRPSSSASSTAPTEADTIHSERISPQNRFVFKT